MTTKQWTPISGPGGPGGSSRFLKWSTQPPGAKLEGILVRGIYAGKFGDVADLRLPDGSVITIPVTIGLKDLRRVRVGNEIMIEHRGLVPTKSGHECRAFTVSVNTATDLVDESGDEDVPF